MESSALIYMELNFACSMSIKIFSAVLNSLYSLATEANLYLTSNGIGLRAGRMLFLWSSITL